MAQTTGPILAIGAITVANMSVFHEEEVDWRVPVATGIAALGFAAAERMWAPGAKALAWTALVAICFTRIDPDIPSPVESMLQWWEGAPKKGGRASPRTNPRTPKAPRAASI